MITAEHLRILRAVREGRFYTNWAGRYVIKDEPRPERKAREQCIKRRYIFHRRLYGPVGPAFEWILTERGKGVLKEAGQ